MDKARVIQVSSRLLRKTIDMEKSLFHVYHIFSMSITFERYHANKRSKEREDCNPFRRSIS